MSEVFAGFVCGYALALLSTPVLAMVLLRLRASSQLLARLLPAGTSAVSIGVLLHVMLFFFWTAFGMVLGLILLAMGDGSSALGSAHPPFTLFVTGLTFAIVAPVIALMRGLRPAGIACAVLILTVFGWLMPYMAGWTSFESERPAPERHEFFHA